MLGSSAANDDGTIGLYSSVVLKTIITANGVSYFNGGSVGIGTATPADYLEVVGSGANGIRVSRSGVPTQFATLSAGATGPTLNVSSAIGELSFGIAGTTASAMTLNSTGLGIGTTTPAYKLQVSGSIAPVGDNKYPLGNSSNRFSDVFAAQSTIGGLFETGLRTTDLGLCETGTIVSFIQGHTVTHGSG